MTSSTIVVIRIASTYEYARLSKKVKNIPVPLNMIEFQPYIFRWYKSSIKCRKSPPSIIKELHMEVVVGSIFNLNGISIVILCFSIDGLFIS